MPNLMGSVFKNTEYLLFKFGIYFILYKLDLQK